MRKSDLKKRLGRPASVIEFFGPPGEFELTGTLFGRVNAALPGEEWPVFGGRPMLPVAQFNVRDAPFVPETLAGVALIALFFGREALPVDAENGEGWLLRAYPSLDELVALVAPAEFERFRGRPARYRLLERDLPDWDDAANLDVPDDLAEDWEEFGAADESRRSAGGRRSFNPRSFGPRGASTRPRPEYAFQLARMDKLKTAIPADSFGYFGRGSGSSRDVWTFAWQAY